MLALLAVVSTLAVQRPVVQGPTGQRLDSLLTAAEGRGFHGNVLVAQRGEVLLHKGYGLAHRETGTRFGPSTLVQIGSNVKDMTRLAIFQLVEQGRLRLTDSLPRFFANVPPDKAGITVQQLMNHRAGLPLGVSGGDDNPLSREDLLQRIWALTLSALPGTREIYSNAGFSLLAVIVEHLSGLHFDVYVSRHILALAGLSQTGSFLPEFDRARIAHGYAGGRDLGIILEKPHDEQGHQYQLRGNGGYLSTLEEMRRFYQALRGPSLLRDERLRRELINFDDPGVYAGSDLTSFFLFANFPGAGVELFIASNHREYMGNRLMQEIQPVLGIRGGGPGEQIVIDGAGDAEGRRQAITAPLLPNIPETAMGRTVSAYFEAYATGDTAVMRRFFTERGASGPGSPPLETRLQRYSEMRGNLGALTVIGARQAPDGDGIVVMARAANGEELQMTFMLEAGAPHRLRGIRIEAGN